MFFRREVSKILVDPLRGNILYAAVVNSAANSADDSQDGIYRSMDGGVDWSRISDPIGKRITVTDLEDTVSGGHVILYAGVRNQAGTTIGGIWRSTDGGDHWQQMGVPGPGGVLPALGEGAPSGASVFHVALATNHLKTVNLPDVVYAAVVGTDNKLFGVYQSTNDGAGWTNVTTPGLIDGFGSQGSYDVAIAFNQTQVFLGGLTVSAAPLLTSNWVTITPPNAVPGTVVPHVDHHAFAIGPDGTLFDANDGGIWAYSAPGSPGQWQDLNRPNLNTIQFYGASLSPNDPTFFIGGSQDNGYESHQGAGQGWNAIEGGDGTAVRFAPSDGSIAYRFTQAAPTRSADGGQTWTAIPVLGVGKDFFNKLAVNPSNPNRLLVGSGMDHKEPNRPLPGVVYETTNAAAGPVHWDPINPAAMGGADPRGGIAVATALSYAPSGPIDARRTDQVIYVGYSNGRLFRTDNDGGRGTGDLGGRENWSDNLAALEWGDHPVTGIAINPNQPGEIWVTIGGFDIPQVWHSTTDGESWDNITGSVLGARGDGSLPNVPAQAIVFDPADPVPTVYVGTDVGVYRGRQTAGGDWVWDRFGTALPFVQVLDLDLRKYGDGSRVLLAGTHGRGAWTITIPPPPKKGAAVEGAPADLALGTFTDTGWGPYTATASWGDGTSSAVALSQVGYDSSGYAIYNAGGTHTYLDAGSDTVTVTVIPHYGPSFTLPPTVVDVSDAAISASPANFTASEGASLSAQEVATLTDDNPDGSAADFTALIDWGDGSELSDGVVSGSGGDYQVTGDHTYLDAGTYSVTVTAVDDDGNLASTASTATITGQISASPVSVSATEGSPSGLVAVASFTDAAPGARTTDYTTTIDWGDGSQTPGTVVANSGGGGFQVLGNHTYAEDGSYTTTISIVSIRNASATFLGTALSLDAPLSATGTNLNATQGTELNDVVARFTDVNPSPPPGDFTATIDWGDGTIDTGTVVPETANTFAVSGSHTYDDPGSYQVTTYIPDAGGSQATAFTTVAVVGAPPTVTGVTPAWGPPGGGTAVVISGTNLDNASAVSFGGTPAELFAPNGDGTVTAVAPAGTVGTVDVRVTNPYGTSATGAADQFTYLSSPPTITAVNPSSGPVGGGNSVTITGTNLADVTGVSFGSTAATSFTVISNTSISATAPAGQAATIDVTVASPYGPSATSAADRYTYTGASPTVTGLNINTGPAGGGTGITISGTNLNGASAVSFGGVAAESFQVLSATAVLATSPALPAGAVVDVTVTTAYGTSPTSAADKFAAVATAVVSGVSPSSGPTGGGIPVTVSGSNFTGATQVYFGTIAAAGFMVNSPTSISATAPAQAAGVVDVTVQGAGGTSATSGADQFLYQAAVPAVTAVSPSQGPTAGGTTVTITGSNFNGAAQVLFGNVPATSFTLNSATQITATTPAGAAGTVDVKVTTACGTSAASPADQFVYADVPAPVVYGVSPSTGGMGGGQGVTVTGSHFTTATQVYFGDIPATWFAIASDTSLTAWAPPHAAGMIYITVTSPYGTSPAGAADEFTYLAAAPAVSRVTPNSGTTAGGTTVTIRGSSFTGATQVYFGSVPAASFAISSDTSITATAPVQAAGVVDVTVATPDGTSPPVSADQFTCTAAAGMPSVTTVSPASGPTGGGTAVSITGTNFSNVTAVQFGTETATSFTVLSATWISAMVPPGAAGTVDVTVTTAAGISARGSADPFTYTATVPTVMGVSPSSGPTAGGTVVTISGTNFTGVTGVTFGGTAGASFQVNSAGQITATAPAGAAATVDVRVTTAAGTSAVSGADQFTYVSPPAPSVTAVSPTSGAMAGGTSVTITGSYLTGATGVYFGSVAATSFTVVSDTQVTATAPPEGSGTVDVTVVTPSGTSSTSGSDQFTYTAAAPTVTAVSPNSGTTAGGNTVTISGSNFTGATAVSFGTLPATAFRVNSDSSITAVAPIAVAGTVDVTVTTPAGTSATGTADRYTYTSIAGTPTVTGVSPASGYTTGGTVVTITGANLTGLVSVAFGSVPATNLTVVSPGQITATAPAQGPGTVDITVTTVLGTSAVSSADTFTYVIPVPVVTAVSPPSGPTGGGTSVTITGSNLTGASGVTFGANPATSFSVISDSQVVAVAPPNTTAGPVDVKVTTANGTSATSASDRFTYWAGSYATEGTRATFTLGTFTSSSIFYSATASWGDRTSNSVNIFPGPGSNQWIVQGTHTYQEESSDHSPGYYTVNVTAHPSSGPSITLPAFLVIANDAPITGTAVNFSGAVASALAGQLVATVSDANPSGSASDLSAFVTWGDGGSSPGSVSGSGGNYRVTGSHTYLNAGTFPVSVVVLDDGGSITSVTGTATITGQVAATAVGVAATEGAPSGLVPVATVTDTDPAASATDFTATIDWGDGQLSSASGSAGTIIANPGGPGFQVLGNHTYAEDGSYATTVTIHSARGGNASVSGTALSADAPLSATGTSLNATQGTRLVGVTVAQFTDGNPGPAPGDFGATIDWGDGTIDAGTVQQQSGGTFAVLGSHTYAKPGNFSVTVYVADVGGSTASASTAVAVAGVPPAVTRVNPVWGPPGGGTAVTISGAFLSNATGVLFGSTAAPQFTLNADGTLTAVAPAGAAGTVDVTVTSPYGSSATSAADQFSYISTAPAVTGVSPSSGPTSGGNTVTITGTNLADVTGVSFGSAGATSFTIVSNTSVSAVVPAALAGTVDVTLASPLGASAATAADRYTYVGTPPTVTGVSPLTGPSSGGTVVTITGTNLNGASAVSFGGTAAASFQVLSSTTIRATSPALTAWVTVDVKVTTPYGTSATSSADWFTPVPAPTISAISPASGPPAGGTAVTISGTYLANATAVSFGGTPALQFRANSDGTLTAVSPAGAVGTVDVTVTNPYGTSPTSAADQFSYISTGPTVTGVSPSSGPTGGGNTVTISGTNLSDVNGVSFGSTAATSFTVVSNTSISAVVPAALAGTVDVTVASPLGASPVAAADQYTYVATPPTVTSLSPSSGPWSGGTVVTITGTNLNGASAVSFGGTAAASFQVLSSTAIRATSPVLNPGVVDVMVTTRYGTSATSTADQFTAVPAPVVNQITPSLGPTAGGTAVTISGAYLSNATGVFFGGAAAQRFSANADGTLTAVSPPESAGTVDVTVTNPYGTSPTSAADLFSYLSAPTVTGVSPSSGPAGGGTGVTISGSSLASVTAVSFGNSPAASFQILSSSAIWATSPALYPGVVDVTVTSPYGTSATSTADHFTAIPAPVVSSVSPASGPITGGTAVTLHGSGFTGASQVSFGAAAATSYTVASDTEIDVTSPPSNTAGTVYVQVVTPGGTSATNASSQFTYNLLGVQVGRASSVNPSVLGQSVTFTATVSAAPPGSGTPTGTVTFEDGTAVLGSAILDSTGTAAFSTSVLSAGSHSITAVYGGDSTFATGTSAALTQVVNPPPLTPTITGVIWVSPSPSVTGQSVTIDAAVGPYSGTGNPTGTVTFLDGNTTLGTVALNNCVALCTAPLFGVGTHVITAVYSGDTTFATSTSPAYYQTVVYGNRSYSSMTLTSAPNHSAPTQPVTFTVTVSGVTGLPMPTGTVTFAEGSTVLGTATLDASGQANLTTATLAVGSHPVTASYSGDNRYLGNSAGPCTQVVDPGNVPAPTATWLSSSVNPSDYGEAVTFTAFPHTSVGTATGTVTFDDGSTLLGTATLDNTGRAHFTTSALAVGTHSITAVYNGDSTHLPSGSNALAQTVISGPLATSTALSSSVNPVAAGMPLTFTAFVTASAGTPTGTVTFYNGGVAFGNGSLDGVGQAILRTSLWTPGSYPITAVYNGDGHFAGSTSPVLNQSVVAGQAAATSTGLSSSANPSTAGQTVTFTATVTSSGGTPTGTVSFLDGNTTLATVQLTNGSASFSTANLAVGSHSITAAYGGSASFNGSTSSALNQVVSQSSLTPTSTSLSLSTNTITYGQPVTLTATVSATSGTPSGTVTFLDGATVLGTASLMLGPGGQMVASFTTASLAIGTHQLTASYGGNSSYGNSTSSAATLTVNSGNSQTPTTTTITSSASSAAYGQPVLFTVSVLGSGGAPASGSVQLVEIDPTTQAQMGVFGTMMLDSSGHVVFTVSGLSVGRHRIKANYLGNSMFLSSSAWMDETIT